MIKRLDNKGLTAVELLLCFAIVSIITIAMFSVVNSYRDKENEESFKNTVTTYKNTLTKTIYQDIIDNKGVVSVDVNNTDGSGTYYAVSYELNLSSGKSAFITIVNESKCFSTSRDSVTGKKVRETAACDDSNNLNIDYEHSQYNIKYTNSDNKSEVFKLPKIQGLRFNEIFVETKPSGFILIHVGLFHNDYGTKYDALNILVPSSEIYPGMF